MLHALHSSHSCDQLCPGDGCGVALSISGAEVWSMHTCGEPLFITIKVIVFHINAREAEVMVILWLVAVFASAAWHGSSRR
jgi:hypothetical protein